MLLRSLLVTTVACLTIAGCATKPAEKSDALKTAFAPVKAERPPMSASDAITMEPASWFRQSSPTGGLQGRTLSVGAISDIKLNDKEVVLTFDDGPMPGKTAKVLDILDRFQVKASFMMVGQMAQNYPALAREVQARGHSIGSHTFSHKNLAAMNFDAAMAEIAKGERAVGKALAEPVGAFRFPYLADTGRLRRALANRGVVVMDVNIDSKDYFNSSPDQVLRRTMAVVQRQRKGIILMHDIHNRTVAMLPGLLQQLKNQGYHVVALRFKRSRMPEAMVLASRY
jgi:peptidoglycan-N-acetylglucosamine deacetylase